MSIYTYLKHDHKEVKDIIQQIEDLKSSDTEQRDELFNKLKTKVKVHSDAEDKIFYKPLSKDKETKDEIPHAREEHAEVEEMLDRLSDTSLRGAAWNQLFKHMSQALLHHIEEEENEIFPDARKTLSTAEANEMESAMKAEKKKVKDHLNIELRGEE
ncbi:hemerythrin domain-containing protein [Legionella dresdenensis]|uniref:Hemerythrin domain-containing protein n=1 Tax=Legionella dresdenensis TaxID=450200 RepID=A0ABV8CCS0_9GAMM